ncbi:MAG: lipoyl(octanoyl) transferase LipB [Gammaproteobacteria bacterium]|nr:lipoyl(octanoyl) transferase LipB [Gammaproteobacteria bacterium]
MNTTRTVIVRDLGRTEYSDILLQMREFTDQRDPRTVDEIWLTEHEPVFTQGQAGKQEHLLAPGNIPVVQTDRGGQVTYHGPGQITGYVLFDLRRLRLTVRGLVTKIEQTMIDTLASYGVNAQSRVDAPGVYVAGAKIGSLGLRVRRGCCYHGLSLNVDMDLEPYSRINPCGLFGLEVTQISDFVAVEIEHTRQQLIRVAIDQFGFKP